MHSNSSHSGTGFAVDMKCMAWRILRAFIQTLIPPPEAEFSSSARRMTRASVERSAWIAAESYQLC